MFSWKKMFTWLQLLISFVLPFFSTPDWTNQPCVHRNYICPLYAHLGTLQPLSMSEVNVDSFCCWDFFSEFWPTEWHSAVAVGSGQNLVLQRRNTCSYGAAGNDSCALSNGMLIQWKNISSLVLQKNKLV